MSSRPSRGSRSAGAALTTRVAAAVVLAVVHLGRRRRSDVRSGRRRSAALLAMAGPTLAVLEVCRAQPVRVVVPQSAGPRAALAAHLLAGVVIEEVLWRGPLTCGRSAPVRLAMALVSAAGFVGVHLRRDGLSSARVHVPNTAGWTAAVLLDERLRTAAAGHLGYNLVAVTLRARTTASRGLS